MRDESYYSVCLRCGVREVESPKRLTRWMLRRDHAGEFVLSGLRPLGCRICGTHVVTITWGRPDPEATRFAARYKAPERKLEVAANEPLLTL